MEASVHIRACQTLVYSVDVGHDDLLFHVADKL